MTPDEKKPAMQVAPEGADTGAPQPAPTQPPQVAAAEIADIVKFFRMEKQLEPELRGVQRSISEGLCALRAEGMSWWAIATRILRGLGRAAPTIEERERLVEALRKRSRGCGRVGARRRRRRLIRRTTTQQLPPKHHGKRS